MHPGKYKDALTEAPVIEQKETVQTEKEVTLDEWFEKWVSSYGQNWAESTKRKYRDDSSFARVSQTEKENDIDTIAKLLKIIFQGTGGNKLCHYFR